MRDMKLLVALKPTQVKNDVKPEFRHASGKMEIESTRFRTRVMRTTGPQVYSPIGVFHSNPLC